MSEIFDFKDITIPFKIKIIEKPPPSFPPIPLIFQLQQKVLKFNDICMSKNSQKTIW